MDRRLARPMALLAGLLVAGIVPAGEVVQFTEFRHLMIESHEVEGEFIRVHFESGGEMLLPMFRVDTIKRGERIVYDRRPVSVRRATVAARAATTESLLLEESLDRPRSPASVAALPRRR